MHGRVLSLHASRAYEPNVQCLSMFKTVHAKALHRLLGMTDLKCDEGYMLSIGLFGGQTRYRTLNDTNSIVQIPTLLSRELYPCGV